jgi:hypothetical protein
MWRYIILIISFIILTILIFTNPFNFPQDIRNAITPWATLSLALVAVLTIIHSDLKEERRNKLHRLQQVMEWATDVLDATQVIEVPKEFFGEGNSYEKWRLFDKINDFGRLKIEGEHIKIISLRVDKELCSAVTVVTQAIDDLLNEDWNSLDIIGIRNWLAEHEKRIYGSTKALINEATKRLNRL